MTFSSSKEFTYIKGFAMGANMMDTVKTLNYARQMHSTQMRKSGEPYIVHPLTMACHALSMGIKDDVIVASLLAHDICEDCGVTINDLPCTEETKKIVDLVTKNKKMTTEEYYQRVATDIRAIIVKLIDRCHNVSSMAGVFSEAKLQEYIDETRDYVMPLIRIAKDNYPEYSNILFILKYHIGSVTDAIDLILKSKE